MNIYAIYNAHAPFSDRGNVIAIVIAMSIPHAVGMLETTEYGYYKGTSLTAEKVGVIQRGLNYREPQILMSHFNPLEP